MVSQKIFWIVTPAKAGVQNILKQLDSGFRQDDEYYGISTFYEFIQHQIPDKIPLPKTKIPNIKVSVI
jgi:hypothetical protein